ncbi:ATP-binding protein [Streptomyces sp. NPDC048172]|uniref:ATP-binding protein n=1 Tax=Streptomyces sp. NPDC048172 TaxID=3365505 RepID=UPI00371C610F
MSEPWEYTLHIPNDPRAVAICRHTLRIVLIAHGVAHLVPVAELLGTELVTNAVQHTKGPAALRICWDVGTATLRIGVWDTDPNPPAPAPADALAEEGRGLALVRSCSDKWGWHLLTYNGKHVWCELGDAA